MSKYRGSNFKDYLKDRGISKEVSAGAKKRWETLRTEVSGTPDSSDSPKQNRGFFHRLHRSINHLFSQSRSQGKIKQRKSQ